MNIGDDVTKNKGMQLLLMISASLLVNASLNAKSQMMGSFGDFAYNFSGIFRPEMFYGKNITLLNDFNVNDKIWYVRHTLDLNANITYGSQSYGYPVAEFFSSIRNKAIAGSPQTIAITTDAEIKFLDAVLGAHNHALPRNIFWMREMWLRFNLGEAVHLDLNNTHNFSIGMFPFALGRGISLGDAYAVAPEYLGFYTDGAIDQYAFGGMIDGDIIKDKLHYGFYSSILQNFTSSTRDTGARIFGQQYGKIDSPYRGFGRVNFVVAAHLNWIVFANSLGQLTLEPYALFNNDPEEFIEFYADASSKLGTLGLAGEFVGERLEFGFDTACNVGQQRVKGWDRNQAVIKNNNGNVVIVNSHVTDLNGNNIPFINGSDAQNLISATMRGQQDESLNGLQIGTVTANVGSLTGPVTLVNKKNRFRNPYTNQYKGWMFVADAAYWLYKSELRLAVTAGIASGDDDPNNESHDQNYTGFIPLQELYSGKRVKSAFLLGGAGRVGRPLSTPADQLQATQPFSAVTSGLTNLVFVGAGVLWSPTGWNRPLYVKPNFLMYWQEKPFNKFDPITKKDTNEVASTRLGSELNIFLDYYLLKDLKFYVVSSVFVPGQHFADIRGKPLSSDQLAALDRLDATGFTPDQVPNVGNDIAYTMNIGLEFTF
jgi:hypothetical protein